MQGESKLRVLVVSHAAVIAVNQEPFSALGDAGAEVGLVAPLAMRTDIRGIVRFEPLPGFTGTLLPTRIRLGASPWWPFGQRGIHVIVYAGLEQVARAFAPDVIFVEEEPFSLASAQAVRVAERLRVPLVVHENQNIARRLPPPFESIRRRTLARAAGMTVRNRIAADVVRALGFSGPVHDLPHVVDPARYPAHRAVGDAPVVGFVGRLVPEKGIIDLVDAMAALRARGVAGTLLVVGDGPARAEAEQRARAAGVPAEFTGAIAHEEVPHRYARMDVVAVPSRTTPTWKEQFGRIVIEAGAAGVPVVVSDSGELPATVAATGGGVVVPEADTAALAGALQGLLADPPRARAFGDAARAAVAATYTPAAIAAGLLGFLREVAAR